ncbi:MAG: hypothetical protein FWC10_09155 [Lentimicrobiaceae bacterium]|nr:hypothetical protein [Lentimicrobiaceae bacterium]
MRKQLSFLVIVLAFLTGCKQNVDSILAEAFHKKLYRSEVLEKIPFASTKEDSLIFMEQYVNEWILKQTLLAQAKQELTQKEQNFSSQIAQYKDQLIINAFFQKISNTQALLTVSEEELKDFLAETQKEETPAYRDMVKLNYIKLSNPSKLYWRMKKLLFDEEDRVKSLAQIKKLCADTIEYYLDSEHWFYTDVLEKELPFSFADLEKKGDQKKIDIVLRKSRYLILILDKKQQSQAKNIFEDKKIAETLIQQQKRVSFITNLQDSLLRKAEQERKIMYYPIH